MYSEELFVILQRGFAKHHPKFLFSRKKFDDAPEKIRLAVGHAANEIDEKISETIKQVIRHERNFAELDIHQVKKSRTLVVYALVVSVFLNFVLILL